MIIIFELIFLQNYNLRKVSRSALVAFSGRTWPWKKIGSSYGSNFHKINQRKVSSKEAWRKYFNWLKCFELYFSLFEGMNVDKNGNFVEKIEILLENRNFGQKSKFWSKIEIWTKHRNFGRKSQVWPNIEILAENRKFYLKSKFWPKIEILTKNRNFGSKSKYWPKIEILVQNRNFDQKSKFWFKIEILTKNRNFGQTNQFDLFWTSTALLRLAYFDLFSNLDFVLVEVRFRPK